VVNQILTENPEFKAVLPKLIRFIQVAQVLNRKYLTTTKSQSYTNTHISMQNDEYYIKITTSFQKTIKENDLSEKITFVIWKCVTVAQAHCACARMFKYHNICIDNKHYFVDLPYIF